MKGMQEALNLMAMTMDGLEEQMPDAEIGDVLVVLEVRVADEEEGEPGKTNLRTVCSDSRMHVQLGLLHSALFAIVSDR